MPWERTGSAPDPGLVLTLIQLYQVKEALGTPQPQVEVRPSAFAPFRAHQDPSALQADFCLRSGFRGVFKARGRGSGTYSANVFRLRSANVFRVNGHIELRGVEKWRNQRNQRTIIIAIFIIQLFE